MTATAARPATRGSAALLHGTRVLLGLFGAFKLYGTAYFTFFATAEQGGDPQGLGDWLVAVSMPAICAEISSVAFAVCEASAGRIV